MKPAFSKPTADAEEQHLLFSQFREIGYDGLQLKGGQFLRYMDAPEAFLEEWQPPTGATSGLIVGGRLDAEGQDALRRVFAFGLAVGSEKIIFCHGAARSNQTPADIQQYARQLSDLGREAAQSGLTLSLHHHYDQPVMHRGDFDTFFDAIDEGTVGLTVDTAHLVKSGITDIGELVRAFGPVIDNVHMKDFAGGEFRVLGQGDIDFGPVWAALRHIGYTGWLCADEESGSDLRGAMEVCRRFFGYDNGRTLTSSLESG